MNWPVSRVLRSIDEPRGILQCLCTMRLKIYTWTVLLCSVTATLNAQTAGGPTKVRSISLDEAVRLALAPLIPVGARDRWENLRMR